MPTVKCSYLDGTTKKITQVGYGGMTLRRILLEARLQGQEFSYGVLRVNGVVQKLENLNETVGEAAIVTFVQLQRPDDIVDLETI